jgi:nicotinamidase/pyrazinamidase
LDPQIDFVSGTMPVPDAAVAIAHIVEHVEQEGRDYKAILVTQDWHRQPGGHFATNTGKPADLVESFPNHCIADTYGALVVPELRKACVGLGVRMFHKGEHSAGLSAFEATSASSGRFFSEVLDELALDELVVCGMTIEYAVLSSVRHACERRLATRVLGDLSGVYRDRSSGVALAEMSALGAEIVGDRARELLALGARALGAAGSSDEQPGKAVEAS